MTEPTEALRIAIADIERALAEARAKGDEEAADELADYLDRLLGWCSPHMRIDLP